MQTPTKIAVAGATGRVGRYVVEALQAGGHEVVPIARSLGVDVITGDGLADALTSVACVVDAATGQSPDLAEATESSPQRPGTCTSSANRPASSA